MIDAPKTIVGHHNPGHYSPDTISLGSPEDIIPLVQIDSVMTLADKDRTQTSVVSM